MTRKLWSQILLAGIAGVVLSQLGVASSQASSCSAGETTIDFNDPVMRSVEYGEPWGFQATARNAYTSVIEWTGSVDFHGGPSGYRPDTYVYTDFASDTVIVSATQPYSLPSLAAGSYTLDANVRSTTMGSVACTTTTPASLTVTPAVLGVEVRVVADSNNPASAIVSARFTGRFADDYFPSEGGPVTPAGEWHITLKDDEGDVAVERSVETVPDHDVLATGFYWTEAEAGTVYSATAEFVPTGASATNFEFSAAAPFSYTAQADPRPVPSSTATAEPSTLPAEEAGFGLPLWTLGLGIILVLGVGGLLTLQSIRLVKKPTTPSTEAVAP